MTSTVVTRERQDLLQTLAHHRGFLRYTTRDLSDDQARLRTTVSTLTLGGLIKHVTAVENNWVNFILRGADGLPQDYEAYADQMRMADDETLEGLLQRYEEVAQHTAEVITRLTDLDVDHALPPAPWFEPGARWSARRVLLHILAETAQHAGHADIIRESLDGSKTMG